MHFLKFIIIDPYVGFLKIGQPENGWFITKNDSERTILRKTHFEPSVPPHLLIISLLIYCRTYY